MNIRFTFAALIYALIVFEVVALETPDADIRLRNIVVNSYDNRAFAASNIDSLFIDYSDLNSEQKERLHLYSGYFYAVVENHKKRKEYLDGMGWEAASPNNKVRAYQQYTEMYTIQGDYEEAFKYIDELILLLPLIDDAYTKSMALHAIYVVYSSLYMYDFALEVSNRIVALGEESGDQRIHCYGLMGHLEALYRSFKYSEVISRSEQVEEVCRASGDKLVMDIARVFKVTSLYAVDSSESNARLVEDVYEENKKGDFEYIVYLEYALGDIRFEGEKFEKSLSLYLSAYERAVEKNLISHLPGLLERLFTVASKNDVKDDALQYAKMAIESHKEYEKDIFEKSTFFHLARMKASDMEVQIKSIEEKNRKLRLENQLAETRLKQIRVLLIWSSLACILLAVVVVFVQKQKAKIKVSLETDTLTKVLSRVSLMESCTKAVAEAKRREQPLSLVVFDLDHFKKINDTFGHAVGDWVLKTVSRVVRNSIRDKDILGRLGGEEFVICLPNTDIEQARQLSERCREGLERIIAPVANNKLDISASFGVAKLDETVDSLDKLLVTADKCLYQAKHLGRNRVATVLDDDCTEAYKPSMGLCTLQAEHGQTPLK